ncbi:helix-turn-helix domain-containing protein [Streptomyces sp. NPDC001373]|uniref:helix-turn-helix domain-containing protein n=1 Tax=Streptomyces sp. NPDC001373 TaxID=3364565 RepID=UPI0036B31D59
MPGIPVITQCRFCPTAIRSRCAERGQVPRSVPPPPHVIARRKRVGDTIRAARLKRNWTQEAFALHAGIDRASYIRIEQGQASPLLDTLIIISEALGVPLADLVRE